ncbi:MAG TPA: Ig-like domain-containing protein [Pyrinomonadaceae bacterium]|nr:Ig-like domain-containing protein [Pyrinomonadaceae bacterium]
MNPRTDNHPSPRRRTGTLKSRITRNAVLAASTILLAAAVAVGSTSAAMKYSGAANQPAAVHSVSSAPIKVAVNPAANENPNANADTLVDYLNANPAYEATELSEEDIAAGALAGYDVLVARFYRDNLPPAVITAVRNFVAGGGGYVGDHWGAGAALTTALPNNYAFITDTLKFFTGSADMGDRVGDGENPINITLPDHPVARNLPATFNGLGGTEYFVRALPPFDSNLTVVATYDGFGGTHPAVMAGPLPGGAANAVLILFDAQDNVSDPELKQLFFNAVLYAAGRPAAADDSYTVAEDGTLDTPAPGVLANDTDADNDALTVAIVGSPSHGSVTLNTDGSFAYTPAADYYGPDSFTYKANDGAFDTGVVTVSINVTPVNDAPTVSAGGPYTVNAGGSVSVSAAGADDESVPLAYAWDLDNDGAFETTGQTVLFSAALISGPAVKTINVRVTDGGGLSATASATVNVNEVRYGVCALYDQTKAHRSGSTIPVKLQLCDASGANLSAQNIVLTAIGTRLVSPDAWGDVEDAGQANPDLNFRFTMLDQVTPGYIFNLQTKGLATGVYYLGFHVGSDPTIYTVQFQIR